MSKKYKAAMHGLSKKERKALEARAAELAAMLEAKKAKKGKGKKAKPEPMTAEERKAKSPKRIVEDAAAAALATPSSEGARAAAETAAEAAAEAEHTETDAEIKARIQAKRAARAAAAGEAPMGGVTSSVEALDAIVEGRAPVTEVVETERGREFVAGEGVTEVILPDATLDAMAAEEEAIINGVNIDDFAKPSEAPKGDFETNGNNQYKVKRPSDGKEVGYTRATTYIANLEDRSMLEKWKMRMLLEGVAVNDHPDETGAFGEPVVATVRDLMHRRDVAIAKARKADKKGKLVHGQLATITEGAWSEFKRALNDLAETLLTAGGASEKAQKGTDIHALCELYDREGIDAVGDLLAEGKITPADLADVEAYAAAMKRAGIKLDLIEQAVVNDELKVGGRLDRTGLVKFPGMARAVRCVIDIKTGRIDLGAGKLAQQLEMYAGSVAYDLDTDERTDMRLSRTKGVVVHLPAGSGECFIYPVDLTLGRKGNKLSGEVRAWRNEGKRAVDFKTDLAAIETIEA